MDEEKEPAVTQDPIACNLNALTADERRERAELARTLSAAVSGVSELPDGYELTVDSSSPITARLPELIELERKCCPFLEFELGSQPGRAVLRITGRSGVKEFLAAEFGLPPEATP